MQSDYLEHYGVKGMKWGVRKKRKVSREVSKDYSEAKKLSKKRPSELSNEQLRQLNKRLQLEQEYKRLNPSLASRGVKTAGAIAGTIGTIGTIYSAMNSPWFKAGKAFVQANVIHRGR